ncbi:hypothetical protein [Asanoa sp. NPDC050611]|uniref:hypothetical protein n=1 Tax=Asanoa sp. NPDC050611 TaxID=3157098 RepID=UPI0033C04CC0
MRIAWLLRINRRYGGAAGGARVADFAARLGSHGCPASAGQVSRWESGTIPVPHRVITGYERALGLPAKALTGIVDAVLRQTTDRLAPSPLDRRVDPDDAATLSRAEDLLDRALDDAPDERVRLG